MQRFAPQAASARYASSDGTKKREANKAPLFGATCYLKMPRAQRSRTGTRRSYPRMHGIIHTKGERAKRRAVLYLHDELEIEASLFAHHQLAAAAACGCMRSLDEQISMQSFVLKTWRAVENAFYSRYRAAAIYYLRLFTGQEVFKTLRVG